MDKKYIGVYCYKNGSKWYSRIRHNGEQIYIGSFNSPEEAAIAYDEKAYELKGDNVKFNFRNNDHICEAPNCNKNAITKFQNYWVCQKHKAQLKTHKHFLERTIYDNNEVINDGLYSYIVLYDKKCKEIGKAKIDSKNVDLIKDYKWYLRPDGYVATNDYNGMYAYLHCVICNKQNKNYADHKDRDKLNNTEENLREADGSENQMNKGIRCDNTSGKVGVHWSKQNNAWCAMICVRGKHLNLGYFSSFNEAVNCRIKAEEKYFQEYKAINELEFATSVNERGDKKCS